MGLSAWPLKHGTLKTSFVPSSYPVNSQVLFFPRPPSGIWPLPSAFTLRALLEQDFLWEAFPTLAPTDWTCWAPPFHSVWCPALLHRAYHFCNDWFSLLPLPPGDEPHRSRMLPFLFTLVHPKPATVPGAHNVSWLRNSKWKKDCASALKLYPQQTHMAKCSWIYY